MARAARTLGATRQRRSGPGHPWYNLAVWRGPNGLRRTHIAQHPECVECVRQGVKGLAAIPARPVVDHITPHCGNWELFIDDSNLATYCQRHHSSKTAREDGGFGNG